MAIFMLMESEKRLFTDKERDDVNWIISQLTEDNDFNDFRIPPDVDFEYGKVYYDNRNPVGFGMMKRGADKVTKKKIVNIQLAILRSHRGKGLGRTIAKDCVDHGLNDKNTTAIYWGVDKRNVISANLAKSLGFELLKESSDKKYDMYILRKDGA